MKRTAMDTLYKYLKPDLIGACLPAAGDGSLRATQPAALNDPFECFMAPGNAEVFGAGNQVIADMLSGLNGTTPVKPDSVEKARCKSGSLFLRDLLVEQLSQRYGIVSFASDPLHPVMWAHYGNYGTGFVIGYDRAIITGLCDRTDPLREIHYDSRVLPLVTLDVLNEKNVDNLLSKKSDVWEYEKEWRLVVELKHTIGTGNVDQLGYPINLLRVPNEAVAEVYYTERTPAEAVLTISDRLSNSNNRYGTTNPIKLVTTAGSRYNPEQ